MMKTSKTLLIRKVSIGGDEGLETGLFGFVEELAVGVASP
jgi:hypothetical protein